jgi:hypothetical protein
MGRAIAYGILGLVGTSFGVGFGVSRRICTARSELAGVKLAHIGPYAIRLYEWATSLDIHSGFATIGIQMPSGRPPMKIGENNGNRCQIRSLMAFRIS